MIGNMNKNCVAKWTGKIFCKSDKNGTSIRKRRFENVMERAGKISKFDALGLTSLVRLVSMPLQACALLSVVYQSRHEARGVFRLENMFGSLHVQMTPDGKTISDLINIKPERYRLNLGRDPILAVPWHEDRFINALAHIGYARKFGKWIEEPSNHIVNLLQPFGVALVGGGNHSLTAGIANSEGTVVTGEVIDLSPLYEYVRYDGVHMLRIHDGAKLWEPIEEEFGILFEIGRLMVEHGVCYDVPLVTEGTNHDLKNGFIYYRVVVDDKDTGYTLSDSGADRTLLQAGIQPRSDQGRSILVNGEPFMLMHHDHKRQVRLEHYERRPLIDNLEDVTFPPDPFYGDD